MGGRWGKCVSVGEGRSEEEIKNAKGKFYIVVFEVGVGVLVCVCVCLG
jgi:hypothetical protein